MRGAFFFLAGILVGIMAMQTGEAQSNGIVALNHVGIGVGNMEEALNFYTRTLGFREAFAVRDQNGRPTLINIQINRDSFIELQPVAAGQQPGLTHIGLQVGNIQAAVARLRQLNLKVEDIRVGRTRGPLSNTTDADGIRVELLELTPESLQRKAMDSWR